MSLASPLSFQAKRPLQGMHRCSFQPDYRVLCLGQDRINRMPLRELAQMLQRLGNLYVTCQEPVIKRATFLLGGCGDGHIGLEHLQDVKAVLLAARGHPEAAAILALAASKINWQDMRVLDEFSRICAIDRSLQHFLQRSLDQPRVLSQWSHIQWFIYACSVSSDDVAILRTDLVAFLVDRMADPAVKEYSCVLWLAERMVKAAYKFQHRSFAALTKSLYEFLDQPWIRPDIANYKSAALDCIWSLAKAGINPGAGEALVSRSRVEVGQQCNPKRPSAIREALLNLQDALGDDDLGETITRFSQCLFLAHIEGFNENFCRAFSHLSLATLNRILLHRHVFLFLYLLCGSSVHSAGIILNTANCYRILMAADKFVIDEQVDIYTAAEAHKTTCLLALLALATKPISPDLLAARIKNYFSITLVELLMGDILEPILYIIELLAEKGNHSSNPQAIMDVLDQSLSVAAGKNLDILLSESLSGVFYYITTQVWRVQCETECFWTSKDLSMMILVLSVLGSRIDPLSTQILSFLKTKNLKQYGCQDQAVQIFSLLSHHTISDASQQQVFAVARQLAPTMEWPSSGAPPRAIITESNIQHLESSSLLNNDPQNIESVAAVDIFKKLSTASTLQIASIFLLLAFHSWDATIRKSEDEGLALNYLAQECMEILGLRTFVSNADGSYRFTDSWTESLWSALSPNYRSLFAPLLRSRYSCDLQPSPSSAYQSLLPATASRSAQRLLEIIHYVNLPTSFLPRFLAVVYMCLLEEAPEALSHSLTFGAGRVGSGNAEMSAQIFWFAELLVFVVPVCRMRGFIAQSNMSLLSQHVSLLEFARKLRDAGHWYHAMRIAEECPSYNEADLQPCKDISRLCLLRLGLSEIADGYLPQDQLPSIANLLPREFSATGFAASDGDLVLCSTLGFFTADNPHAFDQIDVFDYFAALQEWGLQNDAYQVSSDSSLIQAANASAMSLGPLQENSVIRELQTCFIANQQIESGIGRWSSISKLSKAFSLSIIQRLSYAATMIHKKTGDVALSLKRNMSFVAVNKLRYLSRNQDALHLLKDISAEGDWRYSYYLAKLLSSDGKNDLALQLLESVLEKCQPASKAKVSTVIANLMFTSKSFSDAKIRTAFDRCFAIDESHQKAQFLFASYLDEIASGYGGVSIMYQVMKAFAKTFMLGDKYDRVACCKFFSVWFSISDQTTSAPNDELLQKVLGLAAKIARRIPTYKFLSNISQIASKICQCSEAMSQVLHLFILKLLQQFPHTVIWKIANYVLSVSPNRREKYSFLQSAVKSLPNIQQLWSDYLKVAQMLSELCEIGSAKEPRVYLSKSLPKIHHTSLGLIAAPTSETIYRASRFEEDTVFWKEFDDRVDVFPSLQRPKKVIAICSDGSRRAFLCKPKDDLRKDMRFLELATLVNSILPEGLKIQTYAALPLNEDSGIIEWVEHTVSLRAVLGRLYKDAGITISFPEFRELQKAEDFSIVFAQTILKKFPPQLSRWFFEHFLGAKGWFEARKRFVESCGTMSIFGHFMGLGDRHCENILLCEKSGKCMHVDFSCIFEKGKLLEVPERVPFRLTQNIVEAMGLCGWKGQFFTNCQDVMKTCKTSKQLLVANLEPMVNDPISDLQKSKKTPTLDVRSVMSTLSNKLEGLEEGSIFHSNHGHVLHLIECATNADNLARMYVGWAPFL